MSSQETYGYESSDGYIEVVLTGRKATKKIPAVGNAAERIDELIEVKPHDPDDGRWKRLVRMTDLFKYGEADE